MKTIAFYKSLLVATMALLLPILTNAAVCPTPDKVAGTYFRSDVVNNDQSLPQIILDISGNAVYQEKAAVVKMVSTGTNLPGIGTWVCENGYIIVTTLQYTAKQSDKEASTFRLVNKFDFTDINNPLLVARSAVSLNNLSSIDNPNDPNAGTVVFNDVTSPIAPRHFARYQSVSSDLTRAP